MDDRFGILQILKLNRSEVTSCDFNGNYLLAVGSSDRTVHVMEWKPGLGFVDLNYSPLPCHKYGVTSVRFSPKGTMLASASLDGTAVLYNVKTGEKIFSLVQPGKSSIRHCEFTPDSTKLVTVGDDGVFCFWNLVQHTQIGIYQLHHDEEFCIRGLAISPDSEYLLSADTGGTFQLWFVGEVNLERLRCLTLKRNIHDGIFCCDFSPERKISGHTLLRYEYVIATCGADRLITIWSVTVERDCNHEANESFTTDIVPIQTLKGHTNDVLNIKFCPSGNTIASTGLDNSVKLWKVSSGSCLKTLKGHTKFGVCSAFSRDSLLLATGSNDKTVIIWDISSSLNLDVQLLKPCNISSHFTGIEAIVRNFLNELSDKTTLKQGKVKETQLKIIQVLNSSSAINTIHFYGNDTLAVAGGGKNVTILRRKEGTFLFENKEQLKDHKYSIINLEVSPCGTKVISCSMEGVIIFWDLNIELSYEMRTPKCTNGLRTCRFSPDSKFIAAAGDDQIVFLWDANNLEFLKRVQYHSDAVTSVAFSPDSKILASTNCAGDILLYNLESDCSYITAKDAHDLGALCCDFSVGLSKNKSDEQDYLLATCGNDSFVKLWQIQGSTIKIFRKLFGHGGSVTHVRFSPKEPFTLATCANDRTVRVWHAKTGQCIHVLDHHHNTVTTCSFSLDSSLLATGSLDKTILIWSLPKTFSLESLTVMQNSCKALQNWTTSDLVQWFVDIGYPEVAEKISCTSFTGKQLLSSDIESIFNIISWGKDPERTATIKQQLYWLKQESMRNPFDNKFLKRNIPHHFLCPITHEIMKNPIICSDGFIYEKESIIEWFLSGMFSSPMTREILSIKFLANSALKENICKFLYEDNITE